MGDTQDRAKIRDAQQILTAFGYQPGPIDGIIGPQTRIAVGSFQRQKMSGPWKLTHKIGDLDASTHSALVAEYSHFPAAPPVAEDSVWNHIEPPTDKEMADARDSLLRAERMLEE